MSKRCQIVKKMSNCQKDVKCQQVSQLALRRAVKESLHKSPAYLAFSREIYGRCHIGKTLFNFTKLSFNQKTPFINRFRHF